MVYVDPDGHNPFAAYRIYKDAQWVAENPERVIGIAEGMSRGLGNTVRGLYETGKQLVNNEYQRNFNPLSHRTTLLDRNESTTYRPGTTENQQLAQQAAEGFISGLQAPVDAYEAFQAGRDVEFGEKLFESAITYGSLVGPVKAYQKELHEQVVRHQERIIVLRLQLSLREDWIVLVLLG
jgi:hypothetical protein